MINVASYRNGVGAGDWTRVDGFSESVIDWIIAQESEH
jgi:60 kDa SS-A/Ro ribonucleoprotein